MTRSASSAWPARLRHQARRGRAGARLARRFVDPRPRALPDFVVIGAQKSGTSSLYSQLAAHPSVVPALRKEVHHFDYRPRSLRSYRAFFPRRAQLDEVARLHGRAITGEATPFYLFHPAAPARLRAVVPDARLVAVLREPVGRAISSYHHARGDDNESRPIEAALDPHAVEALPPASAAAWYDDPRCPARLRGHLVRGHYAEQLERWFALFPREQLLVVDSSTIRGGRLPDEVAAHLGLSGPTAPVVEDRNVGSYPSPPEAIVEGLRDYFRPHNARLFDLLGVDWGWPT